MGRGERAPQPVAIAAALDVGHDDPCVRVVRHPLDDIGHLHVDLVAGRRPHRQSDAALARERVGVGAERAALAHQADRARARETDAGRRAEGCIDVLAHIHDAQAVRADQPQPAGSCLGGQPRLRGLALGTDLGVARGEQHRRLRAGGDRVVDRSRHQRLGDREHREVHRLADRGQRRVCGQPLDLGGLRVDRHDAPGVAAAQQQIDRDTADLGERGRGPDDGDRAGGEQRIE